MKRKQAKRQQSAAQPADSRELVAAYRSLLSQEEYDLLLREIDQPLPPAIRLNPLKAPPHLAARLGEKYGWHLEAVPFCPAGYWVNIGDGPEVSAALEHRLGYYYIQEAASMLPPELFTLASANAELVLDMAASPGGKTTHLISRLLDNGLVLANDSSQGRIQALRIVLQNWGAVNVAVSRFPGERFGEWFQGVFDKVLLDAPCSMQGLRTIESHPSRPVTDKEIQQLSRRQFALLASALRALRVGGEAVYSTCTLLPREDEVVVDELLRAFGPVVEILDAQSILPTPAPALTSLEGANMHPGMVKAIRLWPHRYHTAGFFACLLRKTESTLAPSSAPPFRPLAQVGFEELTAREQRAFCEEFNNTFGYDLIADINSHRRTLVRRYEEIYLFPTLLLDKFPDLPLQSAGMLLGQDTADGFLPSHQWTSRFGSHCRRNIVQLDEMESKLWMSGKDLSTRGGPAKKPDHYQIVLNHEGLVLGRGKVTNTALKNLLPRHLL